MKTDPFSSRPDNMPRRAFARAVAAGVLGAAVGRPASAAAPAATRPQRKNMLHHVGGDYHCTMGEHWTSKQNFEYHQRFGVRHLTANTSRIDGGSGGGSGKKSAASGSGDWDFDTMKRWRDLCDRGGMIWEAIRMEPNYIYLRPGDERERKLASIAGNIEKAGKVGVKIITMHWTVIPIRRNGRTPGRGGSSYHSFKLEDDWRSLPVGPRGVVSEADYWERIAHFLKTVIPVCAQHDVRMAVHPYDPPGLPRGYQGTENWDGAPATVLESLQRYEAIVDSPYNGIQLCLGTCMEGLKNPRAELLPVVRYFGSKGKIHQVHMRNIRGGLHHFQEVYIDEGEANFIEVVRALRDTGYAGSYCPDHMPTHPDDPKGYQGFAHAFGYIRGLIDAANAEVA
ncbi:MAG: mannonate dehydratase [Opitutaceae bacterium]|nr:mannonate dehydratase [Opitutaceae bacterium]